MLFFILSSGVLNLQWDYPMARDGLSSSHLECTLSFSLTRKCGSECTQQWHFLVYLPFTSFGQILDFFLSQTANHKGNRLQHALGKTFFLSSVLQAFNRGDFHFDCELFPVKGRSYQWWICCCWSRLQPGCSTAILPVNCAPRPAGLQENLAAGTPFGKMYFWATMRRTGL